MQSAVMNGPLIIHLQASRRLLTMQIVAHGLASGVLLWLLSRQLSGQLTGESSGPLHLLTNTLSAWQALLFAGVLLLLLVAVFYSCWQQWRLFQGRQSIRQLRLERDGRLELTFLEPAAGYDVVVDARVEPQTLVTPWLCVLRLRLLESNKVLNLTLLPDSLNAADYRQLRLWLRWFAIHPAVSEPR